MSPRRRQNPATPGENGEDTAAARSRARQANTAAQSARRTDAAGSPPAPKSPSPRRRKGSAPADEVPAADIPVSEAQVGADGTDSRAESSDGFGAAGAAADAGAAFSAHRLTERDRYDSAGPAWGQAYGEFPGRDVSPAGAPVGYGRRQTVPSLTIGEAIARYWKLVLALAIVGAVVGLLVGFSRTATYTSESELNVGSLDAQAQAIPGYAEAAQTLAEAYARVVTTTVLIQPVAKQTRLPFDFVASHVTATNIPGDPVFRIDGTGTSAAQAQLITQAATDQMVRYAKVRSTPAGAKAALRRYRAETAKVSTLSSELGKLKHKYGLNPTQAQQTLLTNTQQGIATAQLQANTDQTLYTNAITNNTTAGGVKQLSPAGPATNNHKQSGEIGGFAGLVVGCVIGCLLAVFLASRRRRQALAGPSGYSAAR